MSHFLILPKKHSFQQPTSNLQNHLLKTASSTTRLLQELISSNTFSSFHLLLLQALLLLLTKFGCRHWQLVSA